MTTMRERARALLASRAEVEAAEERQDAQATGCIPVGQVPDRSRAIVSGVLRSVTLRPRDGVPALEAELYDGSGTLDVVWLGRREISGIVPGRRLKVEGLVCKVGGRRVVFNPRYQLRPRPGE